MFIIDEMKKEGKVIILVNLMDINEAHSDRSITNDHQRAFHTLGSFGVEDIYLGIDQVTKYGL